MRATHVLLTALKDEDSEILWEWINDPEQILFNAPYKPVHESRHRAWFESVQMRDDVVIFAIRLRESGKLIGSCQLHSINRTHRTAELQIRIGEVLERGHGFGTEAVHLLLGFGFRDLNLHRIYLQVFSTNASAIRVYEKNGLRQEGLLREAAYIDGKYVDVALMGLLNNEYVE